MNCSIKSIVLVIFLFAICFKIKYGASYDCGRVKKEKNE